MRSGAHQLTFDYPTSGFGNTVNQFGSQFTPFATRTLQYTKEQLGQAEDKVGASRPTAPPPDPVTC